MPLILLYTQLRTTGPDCSDWWVDPSLPWFLLPQHIFPMNVGQASDHIRSYLSVALTACWIGLTLPWSVLFLPLKPHPHSCPSSPLNSLFIFSYFPRVHRFYQKHDLDCPSSFLHLKSCFQSAKTQSCSVGRDRRPFESTLCINLLSCYCCGCSMRTWTWPLSPRGTRGLNWVHLQNADDDNNTCNIFSFVLFWSWNQSMWKSFKNQNSIYKD